jgi:hypothetical protein
MMMTKPKKRARRPMKKPVTYMTGFIDRASEN